MRSILIRRLDRFTKAAYLPNKNTSGVATATPLIILKYARASRWENASAQTTSLVGPEAFAVLAGRDEALDHLGRPEVSIKRVEFIQPEGIAAEVCVRRIEGH